ncbi:putative FORKHEAD [Lyophyllum shimeji]|uniref:FORKHEAD n=1 Tax=Lyophyllum shimeji TaxID=47721 RepID=A0A9P3UJM9_LYOSH|nr:putative FORKHEAD [Lyophyllum shimeji]
MDTRTRSASPVAPADVKLEQTPPVQDKISAYYSLVFPHFTFYIQTLSVTIGRRCAPNPTAPTSSTVEMPTVDVDLGALKSVSRLHAKIEYDQDEDRFVLVVIGRNGAWVDGVWSGSGTRAPLGERSQIQIASRTFHFVLPPPPPPEDTPSPSSQSSNNRARSPSVDITSISPPSSQPSHTPPPPAAHKLPAPLPEPQLAASQPPPPKPRPAPVSSPQLPNSNAIGKSSKAAASKKRKKGDVEPPVLPKLKPEEMPPKPPYTYAQLIYKAIRAIGEKATLQEICAWISSTHEYYQYADSSWMSSVRHNLSSNPAFQKLERCGGDRGKGFFWKLDEQHSQTLMEQEAKVTQAAAAGGLQGSSEGNVRGRKRDKGVALEPPLKRSVKGDHKGAPLPPPLTSTPLALKSSPPPTTTATAVPTPAASTSTAPPSTKVTTTTPATTGVFAYSTHPHHANAAPLPSPNTSGYSGTPMTTPNPYAAWTMHPMSTAGGTAQKQVTSVTPASASPRTEPPPSSSSASPVPPTPSQQPPAPTTHPPPPGQAGVPPVLDVNLPIVLGPIPLRTLTTHLCILIILRRRDVFGGLTKETLANLEKMGTMAALQVLKEHMVKALKERRAKGRGRVKRMRGSGKKSGAPGANTTAATQVTNASNTLEQKPPVVESSVAPTAAALDSLLRPAGNPTTVVAVTDPGSPIVIVDDSEDDGPAAKRRKVDEVMAS